MDPVQVQPLTKHAYKPIFEFLGVRYCRNFYGYYRSCGKSKLALHREVWAHEHGPIPEGYEVHHKNEDKGDNRLENLECLPLFVHRSAHKQTPEHKAQAREAMKLGRIALAKWDAANPDHRKTAGYQRRAREKLPRVVKVCTQCSKTYESQQYEAARRRFCSRNCKGAAAYRRRTERRKAGEQRKSA